MIQPRALTFCLVCLSALSSAAPSAVTAPKAESTNGLAADSTTPSVDATLPLLTLTKAHETALRNHPRISVAELTALATQQGAREARAGFLPNLSANVVAVGTADKNTRLEAIGALNNPSIFDRNAEGLMLSQLITDFGRTANLARSAELQARADEDNTRATRQQILLEVDGVFYAALKAQAVSRVARQTVAARQVFLNQVSALASNKLRSDLDVSFARVNLEDAILLFSKSQNDLQAEFARLSSLLGLREPRSYRLAEEPLPELAATNVTALVQQALADRPDLLRFRDEQEANLKYARAERAARFPKISAVGSAGVSPVHDPELPDAYAAAGLVMSMPLYAGGLYAARQHAAEFRAQAAGEAVRDLEDKVVRDVHIAWLDSQNALDRLHITNRLLENARQSYQLAQTRYKNGLSSIVELNQAELNEISAEIAYANTQYEYLLQRSVLNYQTGALH